MIIKLKAINILLIIYNKVSYLVIIEYRMLRLKVVQSTLFDAIIPDHKSLHEFYEIDKLLDWKRIEKLLAVVYASKEGVSSAQ